MLKIFNILNFFFISTSNVKRRYTHAIKTVYYDYKLSLMGQPGN